MNDVMVGPRLELRTPRMALEDTRDELLCFEAKLKNWQAKFPQCSAAWAFVEIALGDCLRAATLEERP